MKSTLKVFSEFLKRAWRMQLLRWAGEEDLLHTMELQKQIIKDLQDCNEVQVNGYKLTLDFDPSEGELGFHVICYHPAESHDCNTPSELTRYFHALMLRTLKQYLTDLNLRFKELSEIERMDLMLNPMAANKNIVNKEERNIATQEEK